MPLRTAWSDVCARADALKGVHLRTLFAEDPERFSRLCFSEGDLTVDFSKEKLDAAGLDALLGLARARTWKASATGCLQASP